jgi:diguanylate cyclase (GGDEF)-like protein/PAS domain S-box-containing protein
VAGTEGHTPRRRFNRRLQLTAVLLSCSILVLVLSTALFVSQSQLVRETSNQLARSNGWSTQLQSLLTSLAAADAAQRGYLLTGDAHRLGPYQDATTQVPQVLNAITPASLAVPSVAANLHTIAQQATAKLAELAQAIRLQDAGQRDAALALVQSESSAQFADLQREINAVTTAIRADRRQVNARVVSGSINAQRLTIVTIAILILSVVFAALQIRSLMRAHRRYELALLSQERFVRAITDSVPVRLGYFDREERIRFVNRALCERLGKSRDEILGRTLDDLTGASQLTSVSKRVQSALAGEAQRFEYTDEVHGGQRRIETHLIPDTGTAGEIRGVFAIGMDITRLKRVERDLRHLTEVFDNTSDFVAQTNWRGEVDYINPSARRAVGFTATQSLHGHAFTEFYTPETNRRWADEIIPAVKRVGVWLGETSVRLLGGQTVPVSHLVIAHRDSQGRVARYSSVMRDISAEVAARRALARQTATLNAIVEAIPAMVAVWDVDCRYRLVNRAFERWRGKTRDEVIGHTLEEILGAEEYRLSLPWVARVLAGETVTYEKEFPGSSLSRRVSMTYIPLRLKDGSVGGFIGVAQDVTLHHEENLRLLLLSERDPLTGLLNRAGFQSYLEKKTAQGDGAALAVLYIDLDHFKPINDSHGHATGDEVLREFAHRLRSLVRPTDAVARLGGDEFAVAVAGVRERADAATVADKVVDMARQPITVGEHSLGIGASVGVAFNADATGGWKALIARADGMAYRAKAEGRGRRVVATDEVAPGNAAQARQG